MSTAPTSIATFIRQTGPLPSLPAIYAELNGAVDSPYSSIEDIGAILRKDHSLTTRLLRLANSAIYGLPRRVETLEESLYLVGLREMCEMALATSVISTFIGIPTTLVDPVHFWRHSVACAVGCALLSEERNDPVPERLFVGGLLHDVGRMLLYMKAPAQSAAIMKRCRETGELDCAVETEVLGFDHATLGAALLEQWSMPPTLVEMVRCHHAATLARTAASDVAVVHVADFITSALDFGTSGEFALPPLSEDAWQRCRLPEDRLESIVKTIETRFEPLCEILTGPTATR